MRLLLVKQQRTSQTPTGVEWSQGPSFYVASEDHSISSFNISGEPIGEVASIPETYFSDMHRCPRKQPVAGGSPGFQDTIAVACTDGTLLTIDGKKVTKRQAHRGAVLCVRWSRDGTQTATGGEDGLVQLWSRTEASKVAQAEHPIYALAWGATNDQIAYCHGPFIAIRTLHVSKRATWWKAHEGTVLGLDWGPRTGLLLSCSEDCTYKAGWPCPHTVQRASGPTPPRPGRRPFLASAGCLVLCLIRSSAVPWPGCVCACAVGAHAQIWNPEGRCLFTSRPCSHMVTSIAWAPSEDYFGVGTFNSLLICDRAGWSHCDLQTDAASLLQMRWSADGTAIAAAGANNSVILAQLVDRRIQWRNIVATVNEPTHITVQDIVAEVSPALSPRPPCISPACLPCPGLINRLTSSSTAEQLDFHDRLQLVALGAGHMVAVTTSQLHCYDVRSWSTPAVADFQGIVSLLVLAQRHFAMVVGGQLVVYTYEGRVVAQPQLSALSGSGAVLSRNSVALNSRVLALVERADGKVIITPIWSRSTSHLVVRLFDLATGKQLGQPIQHLIGVSELAMSQSDGEPMLAMIDRNRGLHLINVRTREMVKLASVVDSICWHDSTDMLAAVTDGHMDVWPYPYGVFVEQGCSDRIRYRRQGLSFGEGASLLSFSGHRACVRRNSDGVVQWISLPPWGKSLNDLVGQAQWEQAVRLCRFVKDRTLWANLAVMALEARELDSAEVAYAALDEVDKLQFINNIKEIREGASQEAVTAELLLLRRRPDEAERVLLAAGHIYRALKLNIRLFRWERRALELAVQFKTHIDTVLAHRQRFLEMHHRQENIKRFIELAPQVPINWDTIKAKVAEEKERERNGPHAAGAASGAAPM
ncbi:putative intraflagellar transport protein 80 [Paratrimastix pyriformis]|uniref:Intraflagellar transport protein 80 n=1 Tax=Paratrimastix pyriformis TaxID=342808 RepID=A0ABQ8UN38_9EUKA|nr:putative intraflagellar transport protein 80 [Paratrimastix pyriformis]